MRVLLAGFDDPTESGQAAARLLEFGHGAAGARQPVEDVALQGIRLPFSHDRAVGEVVSLLREDPPDFFLLVGTDPASADYKLHVLAANYADDPRPDADDVRLEDTILDPRGPVAYRSRLPLDGIWDKFIVERVPVRMSHKAGLWVFNHVLYGVMRHVDVEEIGTRCGAVEVPPLAGEEGEGVEPRTRAQIDEEFQMLLAVLGQLAPAVDRDPDRDADPHGRQGPTEGPGRADEASAPV